MMDTVQDVVSKYLTSREHEACARTYEIAKGAVEELRATGHPEAEWGHLSRFGLYIVYASKGE